MKRNEKQSNETQKVKESKTPLWVSGEKKGEEKWRRQIPVEQATKESLFTFYVNEWVSCFRYFIFTRFFVIFSCPAFTFITALGDTHVSCEVDERTARRFLCSGAFRFVILLFQKKQ